MQSIRVSSFLSLRRRTGAARSQRSGFTLLETLVLIGILLVLLSIFVPYLLSKLEYNRRLSCENHLKQIMVGLQAYARDNRGEYPKVVYDPSVRPDGYTAFTGADDADPFNALGMESSVRRSDVTASLWLLVRGKYVKDPGIFICPSSGDSADTFANESGQPVEPTQRGNFRWPTNLSYSYASPFSSTTGYRLNDTKPSDFVLMADKNPGAAAAQYEHNAASLDLAKANSPNHRGAGQYVLFAYGGVEFKQTPYCGIGSDNIYTARAINISLTTQPTTLPIHVRGVVGTQYSPVQNDDSYLVPSATDQFDMALHAASSRPATSSTTTARSETMPATTPTTLTTAPAATTAP